MTIQFEKHDGGREEAGRGTAHRDDCVPRAIAIATGKPYDVVYDELDHIIKTSNAKFKGDGSNHAFEGKEIKAGPPRNGVFSEHTEIYLKLHGWEKIKVRGTGKPVSMTLKGFPHTDGAYIVSLGDHYVAVVDGVAHDTWDSVNGFRADGCKITRHKSDVHHYWQMKESEMVKEVAVDWEQYLKEGDAALQQSAFEMGNRLIEYKSHCESVSGGSTFSSDVNEWLGYSQSASAKLISIAENTQLIRSANNLPSSTETLYLLSTLPEDVLSQAIESGDVSPAMTRKDAQALKPKPKLEPKLEPKPKPVVDDVEPECDYARENIDEIRHHLAGIAEWLEKEVKPEHHNEVVGVMVAELAVKFGYRVFDTELVDAYAHDWTMILDQAKGDK